MNKRQRRVLIIDEEQAGQYEQRRTLPGKSYGTGRYLTLVMPE